MAEPTATKFFRIIRLDFDTIECLRDTFTWQEVMLAAGKDSSGDGYTISYEPYSLLQHDIVAMLRLRRAPRVPRPHPTPGRLFTSPQNRLLASLNDYTYPSVCRYTTTEQLDAIGYRRVRWTGERSQVIADRENKILIALVGPSQVLDYHETVNDAWQTLRNYKEKGDTQKFFIQDDSLHDRGRFTTLFTGLSVSEEASISDTFGLVGTVYPDSFQRRHLVRELLTEPSIKRIARFQDAAFAAFAPSAYAYARDQLHCIYSKKETPPQPFKSNVYSHVTFDFGSSVTNSPYLDLSASTSTYTAITPLGDYDATTSALVYIQPLKIYIELPPGRTMLIPTGLFRIGVTRLHPFEERMAIIQHVEGRLLRTGLEGTTGAMRRHHLTHDERRGLQNQWAGVVERMSSPHTLTSDRAKAGIRFVNRKTE